MSSMWKNARETQMDFAFTKEQLMFKKEVIRFAKKEIVPRVQEHDLHKEFDFESFRKLGEFGILGLHFPEEYGGSGADVVTSVLAGEESLPFFCPAVINSNGEP